MAAVAPSALPHCFDAFPPSLAAYSDGEWVPSSAPPRYLVPATFWGTIGSKVHADMPQHYGRCDDVRRKGRVLYDWSPRHCSLLPFTRDAVCATLTGKQIVVIGDSTVLQFFLSFVHMLGGRFGRDVKHGFVTADLTASACDDSVRLVFVRSDLLLWTHSIVDYHAVQRCDGFTILHPFVIRASRDADIVLLGLGHHFPRALMLAEKWSHWEGSVVAKRARVGFFGRNLNHTLTSLLSRRAAWGRKDPASVVLLGTSTPVRGCARFAHPLRDPLEAAVVASGGDSERDDENVFGPRDWPTDVLHHEGSFRGRHHPRILRRRRLDKGRASSGHVRRHAERRAPGHPTMCKGALGLRAMLLGNGCQADAATKGRAALGPQPG